MLACVHDVYTHSEKRESIVGDSACFSDIKNVDFLLLRPFL